MLFFGKREPSKEPVKPEAIAMPLGSYTIAGESVVFKKGIRGIRIECGSMDLEKETPATLAQLAIVQLIADTLQNNEITNKACPERSYYESQIIQMRSDPDDDTLAAIASELGHLQEQNKGGSSKYRLIHAYNKKNQDAINAQKDEALTQAAAPFITALEESVAQIIEARLKKNGIETEPVTLSDPEKMALLSAVKKGLDTNITTLERPYSHTTHFTR